MQNSRQENKTLAPIALFVYNRPEHTRKVVEALLICPEAKDSDLIVFSDAPRGLKDIDNVRQVRDFLDKISGFKSVKIIERKTNFGLALNIISGVSQVLDSYDNIIVLEDDIVVEKCFLEFMNKALNQYEDDENIFSINSFIPFNCIPPNNEIRFSEIFSCWGWATWQNRWKLYERNPEKAFYDLKDFNLRKKINLDNHINISWQIDANYRGEKNTWACFMNYTCAKYSKLNVYPPSSIITNIGQDGSGEHAIVSEEKSGVNINLSDIFFPTENLTDNFKNLFIEMFSDLDAEIINQYNQIVYLPAKKSRKKNKFQKIIDVIRGKI